MEKAWTVQWSVPGGAPYFFNTRTDAVSWVEPSKGLLTKERLDEAKAEAALKAKKELQLKSECLLRRVKLNIESCDNNVLMPYTFAQRR